MSIALAVWSVAVAPGEKESVVTPNGLEIRITNVALGANLDDEQGRTTVKFSYDPAPKPEDLDSDAGSLVGEKVTTVLCSLTPGKIEQATVDLILDSDEEFIFEVVGKNTVYLTGNYIQQGSAPDSDSDDEDEEAFHLEDVSSDVEIDPTELGELDDDDSGRFEELEHDDVKGGEAAPKGKKRPAEGMDVDDEAPPSDGKLTKAQKKALKKQKGENGEAVPVAAPEAKGDAGKKKERKGKKEKKDDGAVASTKELKELPGGVQYRDVKVGDGASAKKGATVKMRYIGKLTNGTIFDKNTSGKPFTFRLGTGEVIKGWDVGVVGMKVGGERELIIPPEMAYGKKKSGPIPASSTLTFEVKLVAVD